VNGAIPPGNLVNEAGAEDCAVVESILPPVLAVCTWYPWHSARADPVRVNHHCVLATDEHKGGLVPNRMAALFLVSVSRQQYSTGVNVEVRILFRGNVGCMQHTITLSLRQEDSHSEQIARQLPTSATVLPGSPPPSLFLVQVNAAPETRLAPRETLFTGFQAPVA